MDNGSWMIRTTAALEAACARARETGVLALDTEFVWNRTYRAQLGIVQIGADAENCWALDCMTAMNTAALRAVMEDASVVKILHASQQDLMHLHHYTGAEPVNVFDTQLAAAFAGFKAMIGLQALLMEAIDVGLPKTETCTDWTQRPLSEAQVKYALDDVRYLPALRLELLRRAEALGTRAWIEEEMATLEDPSSYADYDPEEGWKRVRSRRWRLKGQDFAVLKAVAALREETAAKWNLPRNWLGDDESLAEISVTRRTDRLRHRLRGGQGDTVKALYARAVKEAEALPEDDWPVDPHPHYIAEVVEASKAAAEWLDRRAEELHVASAVIATRATLTAFIDDVEDDLNPLARGWRWEKAGREIAERFGVA